MHYMTVVSLEKSDEPHFFNTFEPKICKSAILSAVSMSTLKILSRGYNMATRKKFETYKMLRYKELQSLVHKPLSPLIGFKRTSQGLSF